MLAEKSIRRTNSFLFSFGAPTTMLCASQTASRVLLGAALVLALASSEVASQALNRNQMANIALKSLNPCERGIWQ